MTPGVRTARFRGLRRYRWAALAPVAGVVFALGVHRNPTPDATDSAKPDGSAISVELLPPNAVSGDVIDRDLKAVKLTADRLEKDIATTRGTTDSLSTELDVSRNRAAIFERELIVNGNERLGRCP